MCYRKGETRYLSLAVVVSQHKVRPLDIKQVFQINHISCEIARIRALGILTFPMT